MHTMSNRKEEIIINLVVDSTFFSCVRDALKNHYLKFLHFFLVRIKQTRYSAPGSL